MLARIVRLHRLTDQLPPQWYGKDDEGNPIYVIIHRGFLSIRRGGHGGGLESAQVGDEIYSKPVDAYWDPGYTEIRRLCENDIELPESDYGDAGSADGEEAPAPEAHGDLSVSAKAPEEPPAGGGTDQGRSNDHPADPGRRDIEVLIRQWTSSLSAVQERQCFNNPANLNRIRFEKLRKVRDEEIGRRLRGLLETMFTGGRFEILLWVENSLAVPDSEELKLVVLKKDDPSLISSIMRSRGVSQRAFTNTLIFLRPSEVDRRWCVNTIRYALACEALLADKALSLPEDHRELIDQELQRLDIAMTESVRKLYRFVLAPVRGGYKTAELGQPAPRSAGLDQQVYEKLLGDGDIVEHVDPLELRKRYLKARDYLLTSELYRSLLSTPGEPRLAHREALAEGIRLGVQVGLFGIGHIDGGVPLCRHFMERANVNLEGNEVILREGRCVRKGMLIK